MAILEVLAILIDESEDVTQPFLDLILSYLFSPKKVRFECTFPFELCGFASQAWHKGSNLCMPLWTIK